MLTNKRLKTLVIIVFDGVQLLDATGPSDVFAKVEHLRAGSYELIIASPCGGEVVSNSGVVLGRTTPIAALPTEIDTLLVTGGNEADLRKAIFEDGLGAWFQEAAPGARRRSRTKPCLSRRWVH